MQVKNFFSELTWVSVSCREAARPDLSELERYRLMSKVDSSWNTWNEILCSFRFGRSRKFESWQTAVLCDHRTSFYSFPSNTLTHVIAALLKKVDSVRCKELGRRTGRGLLWWNRASSPSWYQGRGGEKVLETFLRLGWPFLGSWNVSSIIL